MNERIKENLSKIQNYGFKPIAFTNMMFEDTFVFETSEEANSAYEKMENINKGEEKVQGWYYAWNDFLKSLDEHKKQFGYINDVYWIK